MARTCKQVFPPEYFHFFERVAIFMTHRSIQKGGRQIEVTARDLSEIRDVHNEMFSRSEKAAPFAVGHTLDKRGYSGDDIPEVDQPSVIGYGVNFFVDRESRNDPDYYLFCRWCCPKNRLDELDQFASISPEYFPSKRLLWPISLLRSSAPELINLPPPPKLYELSASAKYCHALEGTSESYRLVLKYGISNPNKASNDLIHKINTSLKNFNRK
jgi:hypothetical protein